MPRAIIIYDTLEISRSLEQSLRWVPEIQLCGDPRKVIKDVTEIWYANTLFEQGLIVDRDAKSAHRHLPINIQSCLEQFTLEWSSFLPIKVRIPYEFRSIEGRLSVYRGELWLVYDF